MNRNDDYKLQVFYVKSGIQNLKRKKIKKKFEKNFFLQIENVHN